MEPLTKPNETVEVQITRSAQLAAIVTVFTRKRVRGHAILLAVALWSLYAGSLTHPGLRDWLGQVKGADFVHEYVPENRARAQSVTVIRLPRAGPTFAASDPGLESESYLPIYAPQVSLIYLPFAVLPYFAAAALWALFSAAIYAAHYSSPRVWKSAPNLEGKDRRYFSSL